MVKITGKIILLFSFFLSQVAFSQGFQLATAGVPLLTQIQSVNEIHSLGGKFIRYPIYRNFSEPLEVYIENIKVISEITKSYGIKLIVTNHNPALSGDYTNIDYQQFKTDWRLIANALKNHRLTFNIVNEPRKSLDSINLYKVYNDIGRIIRRYSPRRQLMFASYGIRTNELEYFNPDKFNHSKKDLIEVHVYDYVNHLGYIKNKPTLNQLDDIVTRIKTFQNKHKLRVLVGEVAFLATHNDCSWYMQSLLSRFKRADINYTVHAWNESEVWLYKDDCLNSILNNF